MRRSSVVPFCAGVLGVHAWRCHKPVPVVIFKAGNRKGMQTFTSRKAARSVVCSPKSVTPSLAAQHPPFLVVPTTNAFVRVLEDSHALGHRQYTDPPLHFLDAIRQALSASVAS